MHDNTCILPATAPLRAVSDASVQAAQRALQCMAGARGRRVFFLLAGVWLLNLFDLALTLLASSDGMLHEENPIARALLHHNPAALLTFKLTVVTAATAVLFNLRRFRCAEFACALVLFVYAGVAVQWKLCYDLYDIAHTASVTHADISHIETLMRILPVL